MIYSTLERINEINNMSIFLILYKFYKPSSSTKQFSPKLAKKL